jgi:hypothetical protein
MAKDFLTTRSVSIQRNSGLGAGWLGAAFERCHLQRDGGEQKCTGMKVDGWVGDVDAGPLASKDIRQKRHCSSQAVINQSDEKFKTKVVVYLLQNFGKREQEQGTVCGLQKVSQDMFLPVGAIPFSPRSKNPIFGLFYRLLNIELPCTFGSWTTLTSAENF